MHREQLRLAPVYPDLDPEASIADAFEYQERLHRDHRHCSCGPPWCCVDNCPGWTTEDEVAYGYLPDDGYLPVERTT